MKSKERDAFSPVADVNVEESVFLHTELDKFIIFSVS